MSSPRIFCHLAAKNFPRHMPARQQTTLPTTHNIKPSCQHFALLQKIPRLQRKRGKGRKSSTKSGLPEQCNIPGALLHFPGQNPRQKTDDNSPAKIRKKCPDRKVPLSRKKAQSITGRRPKGTSKCHNENLHLSSPSHLRIQYPPAACNSKNSGTRIRNFHFLVLW